MTARILDGKKLAEALRAEVKEKVARFSAEHGRAPGLDVVLVGEDPASVVYTRNKEKASQEVGMRGTLHRLPADTSERALLDVVAKLNADASTDGILVQLPLPKHIRETVVLDAIDPSKDVDGFLPMNAGLVATGRFDQALVSCTPRGCMKLLELAGAKLEGARAVVVGRSNIVGKPVAQLLLAANATVTLAHSRTRDLAAVCREADVLVVAVGKAEMVRGAWIKPGAVVIDVGTNRVPAPEKGPSPDGKAQTKLVGDVCFAEAKEVASAITPVPGGVGPMTIACLLENTLIAASRRAR
ncbi:MAG TPA: bifunctional methylenetetrahydrofolate dehydrogenase/methenyltetrahydrofolate cyclohydrolase FolD [Polyangiaceae bacterium]|nr:bifunctional methylenetetrahydrofolate dehydrogenase/methenyltetrahydrofolate cyclohydrolase FolD [Polyangiaceae bacterium]